MLSLLVHSQRGNGEAIVQPRDGAWDIRGKRGTTCGRVVRWLVVVFTEERGTGGRDPG